MVNVVNDLIRRLDDGGKTGDLSRKIAEAIVAEHPDQLSDILAPLITGRISALRRSSRRAAEDDAFEPAQAGEELPDPVKARHTLLESRVYCYLTHRYVPFGDMTAEQHDARADREERKAEGILVTVQRHRWAAGEIRTHSASCLRQVSAPDLAAAGAPGQAEHPPASGRAGGVPVPVFKGGPGT